MPITVTSPRDPSPHYPTNRLTRNIAMGAGVVILLAAAFLVHLHRNATSDQIKGMARQNNSHFIRALSNGLLERARPVLRTEQGRDAGRKPAAAFGSLDREVRRHLVGTSILKVILYDPSGQAAYSTDRRDLGRDFSHHRQFTTAIAGGIDTEYGFHQRFSAHAGTHTNLWVLSTYLPIRAQYDRGPIIGVVEIYSDITSIRQSLITAALRTGAIIGAAFIVVFGMLLLMVWRADQTVREEQDAKLAMANAVAQAEATAKEKSQFLANMSHELRTPLNAIIGFAEILGNEIKGPLGDASYKEYITDIGKSGQHLLNIINEVLDLVKAESGTMVVDAQPTNLVSVAKGVARMLAPEAEGLGNTLAVETIGNVSAIETDPRKVRQVLINIVANGLKFTPEGGSVRILLGQDDLTGQTQIRVVDTGIGMRPEDIPVAESPFGQVENVFTRTHKGTGLGLPLSRKFIEALGGTFLIESAPGEGTTVTLTLPEKYRPAKRADAHWCDEAKAACGPAAAPQPAAADSETAAPAHRVDAA